MAAGLGVLRHGKSNSYQKGSPVMKAAAAVVEGAAAARVQTIVRTAIPALTRRAGANVAGPT